MKKNRPGGESFYFQQVRSAKDRFALRDACDAWAEQSEADLLNLGYTAPKVAMTLVFRHISPGDVSILDAETGTGIMGALLYRHGFTRLTAVDFSEHMLQVARKKDVYREIRKMVLGEVLDFPPPQETGPPRKC
jgi:predicted TPR repeat methyltransferase